MSQKTILHVFSSNFFSGSAKYAIELSAIQHQNKDEVHLLSDQKFELEGIKSNSLPISNRSLKQRLINVKFLISYIKKNNITLIHAHSRAASWVSYYATTYCNIPLVSTIHGKQVKLKDIYGEQIICICENLRRDTVFKNEQLASKINVIPNGITIGSSEIQNEQKEQTKKLLSIIGRFNGIKGEIIAKFICTTLPLLIKNNVNLSIQFIGNEWDALPEEGKQVFSSLQESYPNRIAQLGFITSVHEEILKSDLVIGAGRVAIETLLLGKNLIAIGEACNHGLITSENIQDAISSNFGDILPGKVPFDFSNDHLVKDIEFALTDEFNISNVKSFLTDYTITSVYEKVDNVYQKALVTKYIPIHIPILMYHKVPTIKLESKHRIFVTKKNFKKQLQFFRLRGLTSITFQDYQNYVTGKMNIREFPKKPFILTFDDGYADNYTNALPLMQKYGFRGVIYLLGDFECTKNFWDEGESLESILLLTTDQKSAFVNAKWEIGAHTMTHRHLTKLSAEEITYELKTSRENIEKGLNTSVISFAYPYGDVNENVKELTRKEGFTYGIATDSGGMNMEEDPYQVFRVNVFPEDGWFQLYKKTSVWYRSYFKRKKGK